MELTFLKAAVPLAKTYRAGKCTSSYPLVKELTSQTAYATTLEDLAQMLRSYGSQGYALMKGSLARQITSESRAGLALKDKASEFLVLDIDYGDFQSAEDVILRLPSEFHGCSYVLHYSSSYKISKQNFAGHLYFLLENPLTAAQLKDAVKAINLQFFKNMLSLNATKVALQWPLDPSINEASRLIYIAPPVCKGAMKDPVGDGRTQVVLKSQDKLKLTVAMANTQISITRKINDLREAEGLPRKSFSNQDDVIKVDPAQTWEIKKERGYVYFNINDGDSWGYYHKEGDPTIIHNFKGEPKYRTRDLLPEYWQELGYEGGAKEYFVFRSIEEDQYYNGWYDDQEQDHALFPVKSETRAKNFLRSHGYPVPDFFTDWSFDFDFSTNEVVRPKDKWLNKFKPTGFLRDKGEPSPTVPPTIRKVLWSVGGDDQEVYERFLNWLAYVVQKRRMPRTAWVFTGIEGTGKGVLFNRIISPIFGQEYCQSQTIVGMEDSFNGFLEGTVFLMLDEFNISDSPKAKVVLAKLKNLIVEPRIAVRHMRQTARMVDSFLCILVFANEFAPMWLGDSDRRWNCGVYQANKLELNEEELAEIKRELRGFASFLHHYEVNEAWIETPLANRSREEMKELSVTTIDECIHKLQGGDFDYFLEMVPVDEAKHLAPEVLAYKSALKDIYLQTKAGESAKIPRDMLRDIFNYAAGNMPPTPAKFTKLLRHRKMNIKPIHYDGRTIRGVEVEMKVGNEKEADQVLLEKSQKIRSVK
jgi:hypothetical protein